jgi:hypothetical protein
MNNPSLKEGYIKRKKSQSAVLAISGEEQLCQRCLFAKVATQLVLNLAEVGSTTRQK